MRASRLLSILILLQLRGRVTAGALALEFEVSERTIHRDIDELSAAGVPVIGERGPGGGFYLREGFRTQFNGLLPDEVHALPLLGLPGPAGQLGLGTAPRRLRSKLLAAMPSDAARLSDRLQESIHIDPHDWYRDSEAVPQLPVLARAVLDRQRVTLHYESWKGARRWSAEPLGLVLKGGSWYMVAASGSRTMTLKVANIRELTVLAEHFDRTPGFDLPAWWSASLQRFERELRPSRALIVASPEGRRRLAEQGRYAADAVAAAEPARPDGWARLSLPIENTQQAARLVLSLAPEAQALEPAELREAVAALARQMASAHAGVAKRPPRAKKA